MKTILALDVHNHFSCFLKVVSNYKLVQNVSGFVSRCYSLRLSNGVDLGLLYY